MIIIIIWVPFRHPQPPLPDSHRGLRLPCFWLWTVQTYGLMLSRMFLFISPLDCFHALVKLFAGKTERLTVFAIAEHEKIQKFIKMVLQLPG